MSDTFKFQASPRIGDTLYNVQGDDAEEFKQNLESFPFAEVAQFEANLKGAGVVGGITKPAENGWESQPPNAQQRAQTAWNNNQQASSGGKVFIDSPFEHKDKVKAAGARWDKNRKLWYVEDPNHPLTQQYPVVS